jgi:site-specific DNA-methyltransferase (adenine-specific)
MATVNRRARLAAHDVRERRLFDEPIAEPRAARCGREMVSKSPPYMLVHGDAFDWLESSKPQSVEAVVTDPPYGLLEYSDDQLAKRKSGRGGVWRIPPSFDGCKRSPLPRFTVLGVDGHAKLRAFFARLAQGLMRVMVPGAHLFIATNPLVSYLVYEPLVAAGFEKRGEIIRLVQTLRGGDRPKNAEREFSQVSVMPRACWEPWGLFRKPCEGRVQDNLRKWKTGGLRRVSATEPFRDVIESTVARAGERRIAPHPSLKPQQFMRQICRSALPLGEGTILDPFMGSGSTIAAAAACGLASIGVELSQEYFEMATNAIPRLAAHKVESSDG